jgi:hypothetical protein
MTAYSIALFLHLVGVLALFAGIALEQTGLRQLRNARTVAQVREWLALLRGLRRIDAPAGLTILVSGGYLAARGAGHGAWIVAGLVGMVLMAVLGAAVGRPRFLAIVSAVPATDGPVTSPLRRRIADPVLRASAATRAALALGIVFVMAVKPAAAGAVTALVMALAIGTAASLRGGPGAHGALAANE